MNHLKSLASQYSAIKKFLSFEINSTLYKTSAYNFKLFMDFFFYYTKNISLL